MIILMQSTQRFLRDIERTGMLRDFKFYTSVDKQDRLEHDRWAVLDCYHKGLYRLKTSIFSDEPSRRSLT